MFSNYLFIALQNLRRQPVFSAIKILSLTLGLLCSILVIMHVQFTYSYDKHFSNWQNVYRLVTSFTTDQRLDTNMMADAYLPPLLQDYQQIEAGARVRAANGMFSYNNDAAANNFLWVEPQFLNILSFDFVRGDAQTALADTNTIVMDESTARKYFGNQDPIGQMLRLDNQFDLRVSGVYRDLPANTHIEIPAMISVLTARQVFGEQFMESPAWAGFGGTLAYLYIPRAADVQSIRNDLAEFVQRNVPEQQRSFVNQIEIALDLEPLADIYLSPRQGIGSSASSRTQVLAGLVLFAGLILITSGINFANLSMSQMQQRGKEIGVRKTLGARRSHLITQFLFEGMLLTLIALIVALPLVWLSIPPYTALTDTGFTAAGMLQSGQVWWLVLFVLLTGLLSGLVPALAMSRFQPVSVIKGQGVRGRLSGVIRSGFTVVQFAFAAVLVLLAIGITLQVRHLNTMDPGFERRNLIVLDTRYNPRDAEAFSYDALINDLRSHPGVVSVSRSETPPPNTGGYNPWSRPGWSQEDLRPISHFGVDENYVETMQLELLAGRDFSLDYPADFMQAGMPNADQVYGVLITPAAVRNFLFDSNEAALDQILMFGNFQFRVVGVVDNFRLGGGLEDVLRSTSVLRASSAPMRTVLIRINPAQMTDVLAHIDAVWARHRPDIPINRTFYEETYNQLVHEQTNGINVASLFAALITILIAAMGLYALAFYSSQRRTKEVGVRKVLGASSRSIIGLLTWDFLKPVLLACAIAAVAGFYATSYFFGQFDSRASLSAGVYVLVFAGVCVLAVLTVALQCLRTARADPVLSLRCE